MFSINYFTYCFLKLNEIGPNVGILWMRKLRHRGVNGSLHCTWLVIEKNGIQAKVI